MKPLEVPNPMGKGHTAECNWAAFEYQENVGLLLQLSHML